MSISAPGAIRLSAVRSTLSELREPPYQVAPTLLTLTFFVYAGLIVFIEGGTIGLIFSTTVPQVVQAAAPLAVLAMGGGLVIATGQIDLASTAIAALCGVVYALLLQHGCPVWFAFLLTLAGGWVSGAVNGHFVARIGAPALVVTWATGIFFTALAVGCSVMFGAQHSIASVALPDVESGWFRLNGAGTLIFVSSALIAMVLCSSSGLAMRARAVGADAQAAIFIGLRPRLVRFSVFCASGMLSAWSGVMYAYSLASAQTNNTIQPKSLIVVAVCVLGGSNLSGGYFGASAICFAALLWCLLEQGVPLLRLKFVPDWLEPRLPDVIFGLLVLVAVTLFSRRLAGSLTPVMTRIREYD